jgi:hypothetical protein
MSEIYRDQDSTPTYEIPPNGMYVPFKPPRPYAILITALCKNKNPIYVGDREIKREIKRDFSVVLFGDEIESTLITGDGIFSVTCINQRPEKVAA